MVLNIKSAVENQSYNFQTKLEGSMPLIILCKSDNKSTAFTVQHTFYVCWLNVYRFFIQPRKGIKHYPVSDLDHLQASPVESFIVYRELCEKYHNLLAKKNGKLLRVDWRQRKRSPNYSAVLWVGVALQSVPPYTHVCLCVGQIAASHRRPFFNLFKLH